MGFLGNMGYWYWLIFGVAMIALEILVPGAFFLWIGLAALVVGGVGALTLVSIGGSFILFAILSIVFMVVGRKFFNIYSGEKSSLNRRAEQYLGQHITLSQAIVNNQGRAIIGDTIWRVTGPDLPKGTVVKVVGFEGNALVVEKLQP